MQVSDEAHASGAPINPTRTRSSEESPVPPKPLRSVLFLCTGNSARSILAESVLQHRGGSLFRAYSAGSHPTGQVHPMALEVLAEAGYPHEGFESKSWDRFATQGAPPIDFVLTVCDRAAGEACPIWPGQPITAHWGLPDPAAIEGPTAILRDAFRQALVRIEDRIAHFLRLARSASHPDDWQIGLTQVEFPEESKPEPAT